MVERQQSLKIFRNGSVQVKFVECFFRKSQRPGASINFRTTHIIVVISYPLYPVNNFIAFFCHQKLWNHIKHRYVKDAEEDDE